MTRPDHEEFDTLAVGWALHALEPDEEHAFADHLATCGRCQLAVRESTESLGEMAYDIPLVDPSPQVLDRILLATGATDASSRSRVSPPTQPLQRSGATAARQPDEPAAPIPFIRPVRRTGWVPLAMAAAVLLVALLSWNAILHNQAADAQRIAAQRKAVIAKLTGGSTKAALRDGGGKTIGYVVQRGSALEVVSDGLAPNNRATSTYVLWAVQGSGQPPRAVGTFDVVRKDVDVRTVVDRALLTDVSAFAVSREKGRTAPDRPSQVMATGAVPS